MAVAAPVDTPSGMTGNVWTDTYHDPVAAINTLPQLTTFAALDGSGVKKLLIADIGSRGDPCLKVWEGRSLAQTVRLQDVPVGLAAFSIADSTGLPVVAVATGPHIFVFRALRPYYKFTLPTLDVSQQETELWQQSRSAPSVDLATFVEALLQYRDAGVTLSPLSLEFLNCAPDARAQFLATYKDAAPARHSVIVCMATLFKAVADAMAPSCLVLATEACQVLILSPSNFAVLTKCLLPSIPAFMSVSGSHDSDYRIVVACRNGQVYTIKNGKLSDEAILLAAQPVGLVRTNKSVYVGCMDNTLYSYSTRGKLLWSLLMPSSILLVEPLFYQLKAFKAIIVSLESGEVRIYQDRNLVFSFSFASPVVSASFGKYLGEEGVLALTTRSGELFFKTIRRGADIEGSTSVAVGPPPEQFVRINIPAKTQLHMDQTQREKDNCVQMHRVFQRDLTSLRLSVGRAYLKSLGASMSTSSTTSTHSLKMEAEVLGLGPTFQLTLNVQNTGPLPLVGLQLYFSYDTLMYSAAQPSLKLPMLTPGVAYQFTNTIKYIGDELTSSDVVVYLSKDGKIVPAITAIVHMPISEPNITVR